MSAPTPAPGDDRPREGYYPDPSIPGYVRYWNGAAWVPGTSRPAPSGGSPLTPPGTAPAAAPVEETGPHFFDEDPAAAPAAEPYGSRPEPADAWGADRARQSGFGGDHDRRVSWGSPQAADAGTPEAEPVRQAAESDGTFTPRGAAPAADEGTMIFGPPVPRSAPDATPAGPAPQGPVGRTPAAAAPSRSARGRPPPGAPHPPRPHPHPRHPRRPGHPRATRRPRAHRAPRRPGRPRVQGSRSHRAAPPAPGPAAPGVPQQAAASRPPAPATAPPGGAQPSWAQQVQQLAAPAGEQPVTPWKPPVEDVFQAAARRQSAARPAGIGKRLAARLVDTLVLAAVTSAAAVPLGVRALDHVDAKIDAAELTGETVTVWLLDGTTSAYLGVVIAVLLLFGVVYEVLPTAKWGRTPGKRLFGLEVRDIEAHGPPSFGAALRRWLVYSVAGLLVIGIAGVLWGLFDRPWRQCWHDKAAHTFVAG